MDPRPHSPVAPARPAAPSRARLALGRRRARTVTGLLAVALLAGACVGTTPTGQEIRSHIDRQSPNREFVGGTVAANNAFATDFYRLAAIDRGNFAYGTYALFSVFAMARAGSAENSTTRAQLDELLHASLTPDLDSGLNTIDQGLTARSGEKRSETRKGKVALQFAEAEWGQRGTHFKEDYLDELARSFGTGVHVVDFRSDPDTARQAINRWGSDVTNGRVEELVPRGAVTQYTRFLLAAEGYFQAPWQVPFDAANTKPGTFTKVDGQPVTARMMQVSAPNGFRFADKGDWLAVELPYLGDELSLTVIQPATGQFPAFEQAFDANRLKDITTALEPRAIDLRLPQFQFETAANLNDTVRPRIEAAYSTDADFSGITSDETLALSTVRYKGFFGVDEEGTEAANTATAQPTAEPSMAGARTVSIDRPFIFVVRDRESGLVLQLGRVVDPG